MKKFYFRLSDEKLQEKLLAFYTEHKDAEKKPDAIVFQDFSLDSEDKGVDLEKRTLSALVSGPKKDRHGDTINPKGWDVSIYKKVNPVLLWAHQYSTAPIGKAVGLTLKKSGEIVAKFEFANTPFAQEILELYAEGFLNSFSVGFRVIEWGKAITEGDPKGYTFDKQELLEISAVPVPAYQESQVLRDVVGEETAKTIEADKDKLDEYMANFAKHTSKVDDQNTDKPKVLSDKELGAKLDKIIELVENVQEAQKLLASEVDLIKSHTAELGDERLKAIREKLVDANKATSQALRDSKKIVFLKK